MTFSGGFGPVGGRPFPLARFALAAGPAWIFFGASPRCARFSAATGEGFRHPCGHLAFLPKFCPAGLFFCDSDASPVPPLSLRLLKTPLAARSG